MTKKKGKLPTPIKAGIRAYIFLFKPSRVRTQWMTPINISVKNKRKFLGLSMFTVAGAALDLHQFPV
ncbi:MAG: energy-converting hydrogenase Eha subunit F [Glaciecola sp.]|jgi:hypothetical protein